MQYASIRSILLLSASSILTSACESDASTEAILEEVHRGASAAALTADCEDAAIFAPGEISLPERQEFRLVFSPDGQTAYYHVDTQEPPYQTIYESHRRNGHFGRGVPVSFSGEFQDSDPFVSPDGKFMFFSSARPVDGVERGNLDLWVSSRERHGWGEPRHLGDQINTDGDELFPSVDSKGNLFYASGVFSDEGDFNIYRAEKKRMGYGQPEMLSNAINSTNYWEFNPWISPNGRLLFFASANRPDGQGNADIYVSANLFGHWLPAINLGASVNTEAPEFHPTYSMRDHRLYFVRLTGETFASDFYSVGVGCLLE